MKITTERLILSEITPSDVLDIYKKNCFPEVAQFNTIGIPTDIEVTRKLLQPFLDDQSKSPRTKYSWAIRLKDNNIFIGEFGMFLAPPRYKACEIFYSVLPSYWGNGYATEAALGVVDFAFQSLGMHRIEAGCATSNLASIRTLEKIGMQREGEKRLTLPLATGWSDNYEYAILEPSCRE